MIHKTQLVCIFFLACFGRSRVGSGGLFLEDQLVPMSFFFVDFKKFKGPKRCRVRKKKHYIGTNKCPSDGFY